MKTMTETELSAVAGGHGPKKLTLKKIGPVRQSNSSEITQAVADALVGGDLTLFASVDQSNTNSGSIE